MSTTNNKVEFVVLGEPASKANSRELVYIKGKPAFIKSQKARTYADNFILQCPQLDPPLTKDVGVRMTIYYRTRRPDLDESVILDCMQSVVHKDKKTKVVTILKNNIYANDRQVREKHIYWALDRENPRAVIEVWEL